MIIIIDLFLLSIYLAQLIWLDSVTNEVILKSELLWFEADILYIVYNLFKRRKSLHYEDIKCIIDLPNRVIKMFEKNSNLSVDKVR